MSARPVPARPGPGGVGARVAEMLRVDHAGELAAVHIYRGHRAVFEAAGNAAAAARMQAFEADEAVHLARFERLLTERGVRPTLMAPLWRAAAFGLGVGAALLGERAAHACTEAVETVIEGHYAGQVAELGDCEPDLAAELAGFQADERTHLDDARTLGAGAAPLRRLIAGVVQTGCRAAIKISERL